MKFTHILPLGLASIARAATPTKDQSMASAIWAGLGGPPGAGNNPPKDPEPEPYRPVATRRPFPITGSVTNTTSPDFSTPPLAADNERKPTSGRNGNSASDRSRWGRYNIDTDYERDVPETGVTREYWLDLIQVTISPDGVPRTALTVNGTMPGPTLFADWGDVMVIHVRNSLTESQNGTSIHW